MASKRLIQLDVLRGIAILLVLGHHLSIPFTACGVFAPIAALWERFGWTGVSLFFVLSGYLIGGLLFHEYQQTGALNTKRFLLRRAFKIWPGYYALMLWVFAEQILRYHAHAGIIKSIIPNLLHVQNYFGSLRGQTWSLAVEEHFYLALVVLLGVAATRRKGINPFRFLPVLVGCVCVFCLFMRLWLVTHVPYRFETILAPTHLRIDSLLWGVFLAYLRCFVPDALRFTTRTQLTLWAGLVLISPMLFVPMEHPFISSVGITLLYLGFGLILLAAVHTPAENPHAAIRLIAWIGLYSYSIYLWHVDAGRQPIQDHLAWITHAHNQSLAWLLAASLYFTGSILVGVAMGKLIEVPALRWRERLLPSASKQGEKKSVSG